MILCHRVVTYQTHLTRQTIIDILLGLGAKPKAFKNNPQRFIELAGEVICKQMRIVIIVRFFRDITTEIIITLGR